MSALFVDAHPAFWLAVVAAVFGVGLLGAWAVEQRSGPPLFELGALNVIGWLCIVWGVLRA